ncbi:DUF2306 domain-containing protein [Chitinimonas sp.]|uniref:DUF2306 domain-containing protein n=1 Tax=Chitinimonas sp. TaxID=1934313 RepID=UPI0035B03DB7
MSSTMLYAYTGLLTSLCLLFSIASDRWLSPYLTGPFSDDYRRVLRNSRWSALISAVVILAFLIGNSGGKGSIPLKPVSWFELPLSLQLHILAALPAMLIGPVVLFRRKGDMAHRWLGRAWALSMYVLAFSGLQMWLSGKPNVLIVFSIVGAGSVTAGLLAIWRGKVNHHLRFMLGAYIGLLSAALFSLMPGRIVANWILALF